MKNLLLAVFMLGFISLNAQSEQDYKEIAEETCDCISEKEVNRDNIEATLGICMFEAMGERPKLMEKMDFNNLKTMEKFGERIGTEMVFICPEVFVIMQEKPSKNKKSSSKNTGDSKSVDGEITGFEGRELIFVLVKDNNGRTKKFLWLSSFENDAELLDLGKNAIGEKVKITYQEIEIYNPDLEEYIKRKEIKGIYF